MSWTSFIRAAASAETDRVKAQVQAAVRSLVLTVLAGLVLLIGVVFALVGAYASLAESMPSWQAGAWVGLGALIVCLLLLLIGRGRRRPRSTPGRPGKVPRTRPTAEDLEATAELGLAASTAARDFVRQHRPSAFQLMLAAFVVGMVASRTPRRRRP